MSPMSWIGMAAAKSAIRSISPRSAAASSRRSTSYSIRACNARKARGAKAGASNFLHPRVIGRIVENQACGMMFVEQAVAEIRLEIERLVGTPVAVSR